jgi:hypothetical protein
MCKLSCSSIEQILKQVLASLFVCVNEGANGITIKIVAENLAA